MATVQLTKKGTILIMILGLVVIGAIVGFILWRVNQDASLGNQVSQAGVGESCTTGSQCGNISTGDVPDEGKMYSCQSSKCVEWQTNKNDPRFTGSQYTQEAYCYWKGGMPIDDPSEWGSCGCNISACEQECKTKYANSPGHHTVSNNCAGCNQIFTCGCDITTQVTPDAKCNYKKFYRNDGTTEITANDTVALNELLVVKISFNNISATTVPEVIASDILPASLTFVENVGVSNVIYTAANRSITCRHPNLLATTGSSCSFRVRVAGTPGATILNTATVVPSSSDANKICSGSVTVETEEGWTIRKTSAVQCINGDTDTPTARVNYNIRVTYNTTGTDTGSLTKVVDVPNDILGTWLVSGSITPAGTPTVTSGNLTQIEWDTSAINFADGVPVNFTYSLILPENAFGSYTNTATGYPTTGSNFNVSHTTFIGCDVPGTGLFDEPAGKVALAIILVLIGLVYFSYDGVEKSIKKTYVGIRGPMYQGQRDEDSMSKFEKNALGKGSSKK